MIKSGDRVTIEYTLKLDDGSVAGTNVGRDPLVYEHGSGQILPALEEKLADLEVDDSMQLTLSAEEGYGPVNPELYQNIEPQLVPEEARKSGSVLVAKDESGRESWVRVHEVHSDKIVLDFNHQLAGERLHFDVKVLAIDGNGNASPGEDETRS